MRFQPGIETESGFLALPGPIERLQVQESWDFERFKVLLQDGGHTVGLSRNGMDIAVAGSVGQRQGDLFLSEAEMLAAVLELQRKIADQAGQLLRFYVFRDAETQVCRYFEGCSVTRFQYDVSSPELYSYALTLHADDPELHETWPEVPE